MESLARLAGHRPVAVAVTAVVIVVLGFISWRDLPLDLFPDIQSPTVLISVSSGDRPAVEMERLYGQRIEQLLFTVQGLSAIDQVARSGRLITRLSFNWQADVDIALVEVNRAVASIKSDPDVDDVQVRRFDPRQLPVLTLGLTAESGQPDLAELRRIALRQIAPNLEQLDGVAEARVSGGRVKQIQVQIDNTRLQAYGLTIDQVRNRINASNSDVNACSVVNGDQVLLVRGLSRFISADDIERVVVNYAANRSGTFTPVRVADVAAVVTADADITNLVRVLASLLVAIFLIPALSIWLLPKKRTEDIDPGSARLEHMVFKLLGRPWTVVIITGVMSALAVGAILQLGTELLPPSDPRQIALRVTGPPGQRVESTAASVANIEAILRSAAGEDMQAMLAEVGRLDDNDRLIKEEQSEENTAELLLRLNAGGKSGSSVIDAALPAVESLNGLDVNWQVSTSALAQALGTTGPAIAVEVTGKSLADIRLGANLVQAQLQTAQELWNVRTSFEGAPPEMRLTLNRTLADGLGVDLATVAAVMEASLDGLDVSTLTLGDEDREIVITLPTVTSERILTLPFRSSNGQLLTVGDVAQLETVAGAREIFRRDQRRIAQVTAAVSPGFSNPQARAAALQALQAAQLPAGIQASMTGEELERQRTVTELRWAGILALLLVLMVLAGSFESLLQPITILSSVPIAVIGVALVLVPQGQPLGIMSMLGFIMLVGVAVNDAILLAQMARSLILEGMERRQALARAASLRLRPIIMTTATTVLALLPMALGSGEGAQLRSPLAWTVVGGIIASTLGSLTVVPCLYLILDRISLRGKKQQHSDVSDSGVGITV